MRVCSKKYDIFKVTLADSVRIERNYINIFLNSIEIWAINILLCTVVVDNVNKYIEFK